MDRRLNDRVDMLCGQYKLKDGYHIKTISMASAKLAEAPALDELQRYAAGEEATEAAFKGGEGSGGAGASNAEANLEALASSLGDRKPDLQFVPGDQVICVEGDLKNLEGVVEYVNADGTVKVNPSHRELHESLNIDREHLRKFFKTGSHVRCINGRHDGEAGMVVKVENDVATVFSDVTKEEFVVFMHDLADSAEVTRRVESIGEYTTHDLTMLEDGSVGMVVRVEKDAAMLMMMSSTPDRPDVRATRLHDMKRKIMTRNISAVDAQMENVESGSMVQVMDGPGKGLTLTVEHIWKGTLWGKARDIQEHGGMVTVKARNCRIHGANKAAAGGRGFGAVPQSPGSALLRSPAHPSMGGGGGGGFPGIGGGSQMGSPARGAGGAGAPPRGKFGGGAVGRRDNGLIGQIIKVSAGIYKGYKGKVVDATETTVRLELQAQSRTVTVQRSQLGGGGMTGPPPGMGAPMGAPPHSLGIGGSGGYGMGIRAPQVGSGGSQYGSQPMARTPAHYPSTPAFGGNPGSSTPLRDDGAGGRTPLRESVWNPTTPRHDTGGWGSSGGATPNTMGGTPNLAGTPGAGGVYGTPHGSTPHGITPRGGELPGTPADGTGTAITMSPVMSDDYYGAGAAATPGGATPTGGIGGVDAGYAGKFVTNAVVVLPDGRQGVVKRREGGTVEVAVGVVKVLPNGGAVNKLRIRL